MRPHTDTERTVRSTLEGEDVRMQIAPEAMTHIMEQLTDLYEDPVLARIREYATNAYDAHIEAGVSLPIEVETPSELKPVLTIRDSGNGMDADDIRNIYSQYGISTKRESDDAVGMLGLGCKSALASCDQFTITSVKNGVRTVVNVARDEDGTGVMKIIGQDPTDDTSGTTISIPASPDDGDHETALDFFAYWRPGTVLLNGQEPPQPDWYRLNDDVFVQHTKNYEPDRLVMGNVAYPCDLGVYGDKRSVVVYVPIGTVTFTPSREALKDTKRNERAIEAAKASFEEAREGAVQREVDQARSRPEAMRRYHEAVRALCSYTSPDEARWEGHPIPSNFRYGGRKVGRHHFDRPVMRVVPRSAPYYKASQNDELQVVGRESALGAIWITGFTNRTFTKTMREKLDQWAASNAEDHTGTFILTPREYPPMRAWLDKPRLVPWATIKAEKLAHASINATPGDSVVGTYTVWGKQAEDDYDSRMPAKDIKDGPLLFWTTGALLRDMLPANASVVELPKNRVEKFRRLFPKARNIPEYLREEAKRKWDAASDLDKEAWKWVPPYSTEWNGLLRLDVDRLDDPELVKQLRLWQHHENHPLDRWNGWLPARKATSSYSTRQTPAAFARYPLASGWRITSDRGTLDHLHWYINAAYAADRKDS